MGGAVGTYGMALAVPLLKVIREGRGRKKREGKEEGREW